MTDYIFLFFYGPLIYIYLDLQPMAFKHSALCDKLDNNLSAAIWDIALTQNVERFMLGDEWLQYETFISPDPSDTGDFMNLWFMSLSYRHTITDTLSSTNIWRLHRKLRIYPRSPSAPIGIVVGHCVRSYVGRSVCLSVCLSVRPSVRLSVCPERRFRCNSLRSSAISLKVGGTMHGADRYLKWTWHMDDQFGRVPRKLEIFHDFFPGLRDDVTAVNL